MKKPQEILTAFREKLDSIPDKKLKVKEILEFVIIYGDTLGGNVIAIIDEGIEISKEINFEAGEIICYYHLMFFQWITEGVHKSKYTGIHQDITLLTEKLKGESHWYSLGLNMLAYFHWFKGEYDKGFNKIFEALKKLEDTEVLGMGWNYFALGVFYFDTKDFENSQVNYQLSFDLFVKENHEYGMARSSNGLASVAIAQGRINDAPPLLEFAAKIYRSLGHYSGLSRTLNDMGLLEKTNKNYPKSITLLNESIELRKEIEHLQGLITSYTELGETYLFMKEHAEALKQLNMGLDLALRLNTRQKRMRLHKLLYDTYKEQNNTELALKNFEEFFEIKSKLMSDETANNIKKIQTKHEKEKSEKEAEIERLKNIELKKANAVIEQKNKDITDSINYAKRIQLSILPSKEVLDSCFENYFVLYKPKDIVSGDFYWALKSANRKTNDKLSIIAAVDCTGHGVPGAFMSMLANTLLNQTILNPDVVSSADVLNYLNVKLPENLKSTGQDLNIRDGMDMALCIFDMKNRNMQFAGANNPCWIIRKGELIELKADKQAISASNDIEKTDFTNHNVNLEKGDCVYLITDGFADQFGGPREKKFTYKQLKEVLISNSTKAPHEQKKLLDMAFENWRKDVEQIDDVCVIGIMVQ